MLVVFYVSGHGFGHASRDIEVANRLVAREPEARVIVRTAAPRWLFDLAAADRVEFQSCETDTGVVQIDSLRLDEDETARRAAAFYADFDRRVAGEASFLESRRPSIVVGDIPPLAFAAAARAGVPALAIGNFTWDWIYEAYATFEPIAPHVIPTIRDAYRAACGALRLPLHGGFTTMGGPVVDIPFIARRSERDPHETRRALGLPEGRPIVLASFGAYGVRLPYAAVACEGDLTVVTTDRSAGGDPPENGGAIVRIDERALYDHGFRYEDLVAAVDVVVTKPGYGIVSECLANDTALIYTSRGRFAEYDVFVAGMPRVVRCRFVPQEDLLAGRWSDAVRAVVDQPRAPERPRIDGAEIAAQAILQLAMR